MNRELCLPCDSTRRIALKSVIRCSAWQKSRTRATSSRTTPRLTLSSRHSSHRMRPAPRRSSPKPCSMPTRRSRSQRTPTPSPSRNAPAQLAPAPFPTRCAPPGCSAELPALCADAPDQAESISMQAQPPLVYRRIKLGHAALRRARRGRQLPPARRRTRYRLPWRHRPQAAPDGRTVHQVRQEGRQLGRHRGQEAAGDRAGEEPGTDRPRQEGDGQVRERARKKPEQVWRNKWCQRPKKT